MYDKKHAYLPHQENSHAPYLAQLRNISTWVIAVFFYLQDGYIMPFFLNRDRHGESFRMQRSQSLELLAPATTLGLFSPELKRSQIYEKISVHINHFNILVPTKQNLEMSY